jgi:hypothetical protein
MKRILLSIGLLATLTAQAQKPYTKDSLFTVYSVDSLQGTWCDIVEVQNLNTTYNRLQFVEIRDYGKQPTATGTTYSAAAFFNLVGDGGTQTQVSVSINNIESNDYDMYKKYGTKFLFWRLSNQYQITLK